MSLRFRFGMLLCLLVAAASSAYGALSSISAGSDRFIPQEVYAQLTASESEAEFYLRPSGGYVAVYPSSRLRAPITVTGIELSELRGADRALVERGIPVADEKTLLSLLEDLGS